MVVSTNASEERRSPWAVCKWSLLAAALVFAVLSGALACAMFFPVRWDGSGMYGALALFFPLHLLAAALLAMSLAVVARRCRARLAAWLFGLASIGVSAMALAPTLAIWQRARELGVPLSLSAYLDDAAHLNMGSPQSDRSVVYGTAPDGTALELDVWRSGLPDTGPPRPAIVMVHGGAWTSGNRSSLPDRNRWLNELGYEVFDVEYRLPPQARWQDEVGDVKAAAGWVLVHAGEYHVDPARICMMGGAAGGNLALLAAYSMGDPRLPPSCDVPPVAICCAINLYGPMDLELLHRTCKSPEYVQGALSAYIGGGPDEFPQRYRLLSPVAHVSAKSPPTITLTGTLDRLVSVTHAEALDAALARCGVAHELYLLPASDHGFDVNWGGFATQIARAKVKDFLHRHAPVEQVANSKQR
jgi:acetyl esterase/lipase